MTERPILFSAPMVRAILDGRKTQTRRVAWLPGPIRGTRFFVNSPLESIERFDDGSFHYMSNGGMSGPYPCPYGAPGDRLWVRETFCLESNQAITEESGYLPPHNDGRPVRWADETDFCGKYWEQPHYRATDRAPELAYDDTDEPACRWRPSIHMPRWASRIILEITDVWCERLQDISEDDAKAEGLRSVNCWRKDEWVDGPAGFSTAKAAFRDLWDSINAKRAPWESNPFVWAITFRRVGLL